MPTVNTKRALPRRHFLRGAGVALALPLLDAMTPALARAESKPVPRRFFGICNNLGLLPEQFFPNPESVGAGYQMSPYLQHLAEHRNDFTVLNGVWHPDVDGGHPADNCFLTAAPHPSSGGFRNTISLDQFAAERLGNQTRFPSLTLGVNSQQSSRSLSWTRGGVLIPSEQKASKIYERLFIAGTPEQRDAQMRKLKLGQSIMDTVADQTRSLESNIGPRDRARLDQYLTGVRDLEHRLLSASEWELKPRPAVKEAAPVDPADPKAYMDKVRLMYDMARMAFETDSTRFVALMLDSVNSPAITVDGEGTSDGYHNLSHHGKNPTKLRDLERIDRAHMKQLAQLFSDLKTRQEDGESLLDRTMILYGSNMGNANTHVTTNLPVLFAGGGFRHGQHLLFDRERNYPLPNLFVSVLHRLGIEEDKFATSTGSMRGLELRG
ncbi:MAG: DUF1552 domain-containing protein [Bryobacteraceae bacterium]|nr:DUF1552 domain-containing protein [Bryobacteraceae bacterium]